MFNLFEIKKKTNWEFIKSNDTEKSWNLFLEYFILNFDRYCPKINKASHKNKLIPWNTRDLKKACRKKQILYKKYLNLKMTYLFTKFLKIIQHL